MCALFQNQVQKFKAWHLQQMSQCEVDWIIHKVSVKHSWKAIIIKWACNQEFKQQSYKTQVFKASTFNNSTREPKFKVSKLNMETHIQLSQILNNLILSSMGDMVNISKTTLADIQAHHQHTHEMIEFLELESQLQRDELQ